MRSGYTVVMNFDNAGLVKAKVRWYACEDGAEDFPTPHLFCSIRTWNWHGLMLAGPGEDLPGGVNWNSSAPPGFFPGTGPFCGPYQWFKDGCPSDAPPLVIGDDGTPLCCRQPPCQPWYEASIFGTRLAFGTPGYPWVLNGDGFDVSEWVSHGDSNVIDFTPGGEFLCQGLGSTIASCLLTSPDYSFDLGCVAYNPATYTGTFKPLPGSVAPPGFVVQFKCPPL